MTSSLIDRNGLEILDRAECLRLLATVSLCRVGVTLGALPAILPVRFALHDGELLVRASRRSRLPACLRDTVVAVQADDVSAGGAHHGWSVLVRGRSRELVDPVEQAHARSLGLVPWSTDGADDRYFGIAAEWVTGRRLHPATEAPRPAGPTT